VSALNALDVPACMLDQTTYLNNVWESCLSGEIKLLYITPEKFAASQRLTQLLDALNERKLLQRIVGK
jgi:superfamily II DNA helicase RecQ